MFLRFVYCHLQNSVLAKGKLGPLWRVRARARARVCVCVCGLKWVCCRLRHIPSIIIYATLLCLGDILMSCIYMFSYMY